jgi:hypothetical protein
MKISEDQIVIPPEKITGYLLVKKEKNDKSGFLKMLGYTVENWEELAKDVKQLALQNELVFQKKSEFGDLYSIKGFLKSSAIVTIWFQQISGAVFRFITLYPDHEQPV